jgi:hypothetical protein
MDCDQEIYNNAAGIMQIIYFMVTKAWFEINLKSISMKKGTR